MEDFLTNMAIASFGLLIAGGLFLAFLNWLEEQWLIAQNMGWGEVIIIAIFFGVAALVALGM
jgi:uncharacterized membrane protein